MTNSGIKNSLKNMLFQRYQKLLLSYEEVQKEVLDNPRLVVSSSVVPNTWLIDDVVSYLCLPYEMSINKNTTQKEKKQLVIKEVDKALQKYWNKTHYVSQALAN
ncbi:MAG: hypothetical protein JHC37_02370 [Campylobacteraceae bacterium]|jgi:hypothetical protein|nr:hypothetical protein [Campylobacteraceae bacterium]